MNVLDLLNENEKRVFSQLLKGLPISQVADTQGFTTGEANKIRLRIIAKFEQASPGKSPKSRCLQV